MKLVVAGLGDDVLVTDAGKLGRVVHRYHDDFFGVEDVIDLVNHAVVGMAVLGHLELPSLLTRKCRTP